MNPGRPNVLLVVIDQLRADALGCMGSPCAHTPNIDRLARRGVLFTRHHAQGAPCGPSRASMATGQYQMSHRVVNNETPTAAHLKTLPWFLREAGYEPALVGYTTTLPDLRALHPGLARPRTHSIAAGWDVVRDFEGDRRHYLAWLSGQGYSVGPDYAELFRCAETAGDASRFPAAPIAAEHTDTAWCADGALDYLRVRAGRPWFLQLGFFRPHPPFMATAPFDALIDPGRIPPPVRAASVAHEAAVHPLNRLLLETLRAGTSVTGMAGLSCDVSPDDLRRIAAAYHGLLAEVDHHLGRVLDHLDATGQSDHTLVILTSDHAEQLGDHHLLSKRGYYPSSYHVPCIVADPRREADATRGGTVTAFSENVDLLPTILDWLGQPIPEQCDGRSLLGFLRGAMPSGWRREARWEYDFRDLAGGKAPLLLGIARHQCSLAVIRDTDYAYVHFAALPPLLFDLRQDPAWLANRADDPSLRDVALDMARRMLDWRLAHADRTLT